MPNSTAPGVVLEPSSPLDNEVQRIDNDPLAPVVTSTPGTGTTLWRYAVVGRDGGGGATQNSAAGTTTTGEAALDSDRYNTIAWQPIPGAASYDVINIDTGLYVATGVMTLEVDDIAGPPAYQFQFFNSTFPEIADPNTAPEVTVVGTPGSAFYSFFIVAHGIVGQTLPGPSVFLFNGPNTLSAADYLTVIWDPVPDAVSYDLIDGSNSVLRASGLLGTTFDVTEPLPRATPVLANTIQALKVADGLRFTNDSNLHWDSGQYPRTMGLFFPANNLIPGHPGVQPDSMGLVAAGEVMYLLAPTVNVLQGENAQAIFQGRISAYSAAFSSNDDLVTPLVLQRYSATQSANLLEFWDEQGLVLAAIGPDGFLSSAILRAPAAIRRNTIQPTAPDVSPLELQAYSPSSTANYLTCLASDGVTELAQINALGVGIFSKLALAATDPSQTLLSAITAPNPLADQNQVSLITNVNGAGASLNQFAIVTDASLWWNAKTTTTFRTQAKLIPSWLDPVDATRKAQLSFQVRGTGAGTIEALNLATDGTSPTLGALGAAPVGRQTLPAAATDLATTQALANSLRALAIAFGFGA